MFTRAIHRPSSTMFTRAAVAGAVSLAAGGACAQSITNLGVLGADHHFSQGVAVSGDGAVVAGNSGVGFFQQTRSFRWTRGGGAQDIGALADAVNTFAQAINADGTAMAGSSYSADRDSAFRWTASGGVENLGALADAPYGANAAGISGDGAVVAGTSSSLNGDRAYRWTRAGGMQDLGVLAGGSYSFGLAISADGNTVTGLSESGTVEQAFVWTSGGGMVALPGGGEPGAGLSISADGSVVAGYSGLFAARWDHGVLQSLGTLAGGTFSAAYALSGDGAIAGGMSDNSDGDVVATIWTAPLGILDLNTYLPTLGIDLSGWRLTTTTGLSGDGSTIVGAGVYNGEDRGWVVTVPAPGAAAVLGLGGLVAAGRRRRR